MAHIVPNFIVQTRDELQFANTNERLLDAYLEQLGLAASPATMLGEIKNIFNTVAPAGYEVGELEHEIEAKIDKERGTSSRLVSLYDDAATRRSVH